MRGNPLSLVWCGAVSALLLLTGCSGEPTFQEKYSAQWKECEKLFGAENMDSLLSMHDADGLRFSSPERSAESIAESLAGEARESYDEIRGFHSYAVCGFSGNPGFSSTVRWSPASSKEVRTDTAVWRRVTSDIYTSGKSGQPLDMVLRCVVPGAEKTQEQELLQVGVGRAAYPKFTDAFQERLAVHLAQVLRDEIGCANQPEVPETLRAGR